MEIHSGIKSDEILNRKLTGYFPNINEEWLSKKIRSILVLKNQSITTWKQRPFLLKLPSTQYSIEDVDFMYQNCSFFPVKDSSKTPTGVCVAIHDVTEMAITQRLLEDATEQALDLEEKSVHDHLTGLFNRQYFFEQFSQDIVRCRRLEQKIGVALVDADYFKKINDNYSHQAGDFVLIELAKRLESTLRSSDTLCRYGGEEFVLLLPNINTENAVSVCERIRECVCKSPIAYRNDNIDISVSIGLTMWLDGMSIEEAVDIADRALYSAKDNGRNCVKMQ